MEHIQQTHQIWNHYDELGLLIGITRTPGESNFDLRKRIFDSHKYIANSSLQGLTNALNRDFGYIPYNVIDKKIYILDQEPLIDYNVSITVDGKTDYQYDQMVESIPLPDGWVMPSGMLPAPGRAIDQPPVWSEAALASGAYLPNGWILWRYPNGEYSRILEFLVAPKTGAAIKVTYRHRVGETIYQRVDQDFVDMPIVEDEVYGLDGTYTGYNKLVANASGHVRVFALNDTLFLSDTSYGLWTQEGTATTKLEAIVEKIHQTSPIFWGDFVADRAYWDAGSEKFSGIESLPSIFDASVSGYYRSYDTYYKGAKSDFESGIGHKSDLYSSRLTIGHLDTDGFHTPLVSVSRLIY